MRSELGKAQETVQALQQPVCLAEGDLYVSRMDVESVNVTLSSSVQKIQNLLDKTWSLRKDRAEMLKGINDIRRKNKERQEVYVPLHLLHLSCFDLIPTFLFVI